MSGPLPKPTALRAIEGDKGKRGRNKQEPDPEYLVDTGAPEWLHPEAKAVWDELAPQFQKARLIAKVDVELFAQGCVYVAQFRKAHREIGSQLIQGADKGGQMTPWMIVQSMSFKAASNILGRFGGSPADRTRIALQPQMDLFSVPKDGSDGNKDNASKYFKAG